MNKIIHLSLARKSVPILMDIVQGSTEPSIEFIIDDYTPHSNARARIYIKKEGGEVYNDCRISENIIFYTPTAGSFDVAGECVAQLELIYGSTVAISWRIFVTVEPNIISGSSIPASDEFGALTELIQTAQGFEDLIGANNATGYDDKRGWIELTSGQDLNNLLTPGIYIAKTGTIANSLLHYISEPPNTPMKMFVTELGGLRKRQTIEFTLPKIRTYNRITYDGGHTWNDWIMEPEREIPAPKTEIYKIAKFDDEGRIRFWYRLEYEGELTPVYGVLQYRRESPDSFLTKVMEAGDPGITVSQFSIPDGSYRTKDIGFGVYTRLYIKLGEEYIYGDQLYVRYDEL